MTTEERLEEVECVIEANSFEASTLWEKHHEKIDWVQEDGVLRNVGTINDKPIVYSILFYKLSKVKVMMWYPTSRIVDYNMIEEDIKKSTPNAKVRVDANNFHQALNHIVQYVFT